MKRSEVGREDLARALAERSRASGKQLTEGQAQDELDRVVHAIVTNLRRGRSAKMPGVGTMTARASQRTAPATKSARKPKS